MSCLPQKRSRSPRNERKGKKQDHHLYYLENLTTIVGDDEFLAIEFFGGSVAQWLGRLP